MFIGTAIDKSKKYKLNSLNCTLIFQSYIFMFYELDHAVVCTKKLFYILFFYSIYFYILFFKNYSVSKLSSSNLMNVAYMNVVES